MPSVTAGVSLPKPSTLELREFRFSSGSSILSDQNWCAAAQRATGGTSSTAYQEVVNITGPGMLKWAFMCCKTDTFTSNAKFRLIADGVTLVDDTASPSAQNGYGVGAHVAGGTSLSAPLVFQNEYPLGIEFKTSLTIEVSGDGTDAVNVVYERTLY